MTRAYLHPSLPPLAQDEIIKSLRKAAKKSRPSVADGRPSSFYDPYLIYKHLAEGKPDKKLSCRGLRDKAAVLLLMDAALRVDDLTRFFVENMQITDKRLEIRASCTKELKQLGWCTITVFCSCSPWKKEKKNQGQTGKEGSRELSESARSPGSGLGPHVEAWRRNCCAFCSTKAYLEHKTAARRRKKVKIAYSCPEGEKKEHPSL